MGAIGILLSLAWLRLALASFDLVVQPFTATRQVRFQFLYSVVALRMVPRLLAGTMSWWCWRQLDIPCCVVYRLAAAG